MRDRNSSCNCQTKSGSVGLGGEKRLKNPVDLRFGNHFSGIFDVDGQLCSVGAASQLDASAVGGSVEGVQGEVQEGTFDLAGIDFGEDFAA